MSADLCVRETCYAEIPPLWMFGRPAEAEAYDCHLVQAAVSYPLRAIGPAGSKGRLVDEGLPLKRDRPANREETELLRRVRLIIEQLKEKDRPHKSVARAPRESRSCLH
jgi:hypothetical protein